MKKKFNIYTKRLLFLNCLIAVFIYLSLVYLSEIDNKKVGSMMEEFNDVYKDFVYYKTINNDVVATLETTNKTLPIVKGKDNEMYLNLSINKEDDIYGTPFLDVNIDYLNSDILIIYGHSTINDQWGFTFLKHYFDKNAEIEKTMVLNDEKGRKSFKVVASKIVDSNNNGDRSWVRYGFDDYEDKERYLNKFIKDANQVFERRIKKDARILLLVTCQMENKNKRYVLMLVEE